MKPKKNQGADLGRRRTIFFEAGLAAAIAVVVTVFSVSQKERVVNTAWAIPDGDLFQEQIDRTVDKPEEKKVAQKVMVQAVDILKVVKNNHKILDPFTVMDPGAFEYFPVLEPMVEVIEDDVVDTAERMPKFLGGDLMTFRNWVFERLKYPQIAVDMGLEGKVVLQFVIEKDGTLSNISVLYSPDRLLTDEAIRVVSQSPQWSPAFMGTRAVRLRYTLPVDFRISK